MLSMQLPSKLNVFLLAGATPANRSNKPGVPIPPEVFTRAKISLHRTAPLSLLFSESRPVLLISESRRNSAEAELVVRRRRAACHGSWLPGSS